MQADGQVNLCRQDNIYVTVCDTATHDQGEDLSLAV